MPRPMPRPKALDAAEIESRLAQLDGWSLALDFKVHPGNRASLWAHCRDLTELVLDAGEGDGDGRGAEAAQASLVQISGHRRAGDLSFWRSWLAGWSGEGR